MSRQVIDASIAIKWVVEEPDSPDALAILDRGWLFAPDLIVPECANILWRKVRRGDIRETQATLGARPLEQADIDSHPTRQLVAEATRLAIALDHAAYDCVYLALAVVHGRSAGRSVASRRERLQRPRQKPSPHARVMVTLRCVKKTKHSNSLPSGGLKP